jgi:hypothetical protein
MLQLFSFFSLLICFAFSDVQAQIYSNGNTDKTAVKTGHPRPTPKTGANDKKKGTGNNTDDTFNKSGTDSSGNK